MTPGGALLRTVTSVRRRSLLLGASRVVSAALAAGLAVVLAASLALRALPEGWRIPWAGAALGCAVLAAVLSGLRELRRARPRLSPARAAELLGGPDPAVRELLLTGADLAAWGEGGAEARGASPALAGAQVEAAAAATRGRHPAAAVPGRPALRKGLLVGALAALAAAWAAADPMGRGVWAGLLSGGPPVPVAVGNLRLVYGPPAYTGLPERRVEGAEGSVEGYRGTWVTLEGEVSRPVDGGRWEGPGGAAVPLAVEGRGFRVSWILEKPGQYSLAFERGGRAVPSDFVPRSVRVAEDARPAAELHRPEGDLEVTADQEVEVAFSAQDDFGVERAELVLQGEEEVRIPLAVTPGRRAQGRGHFLPLAHPGLGEGAHLRVEVWDGDTVSGPKAGSTRSVYVAFLDKRRLAAEIAGLEERLLEALLGHLADHLEAPEAGAGELERLRAGGRDLLRLLDQLSERVGRAAGEGALGAVAVLRMEAGLRSALEPFLAGGADREGLVAELERDALLLDRLLRSLRMEEALSLGDELAALQRNLFDELLRGADPGDLAERVARLEELLAELARALGRGAAELPEDFANADAVRDLPASDLERTLAELREALERGDRDGAQALAEKLLDTLGRWLAALEDAAGGAARAELDPLHQELSEIGAEVRELASGQEAVLGETQDVGREASRRASELLRDAVEGLLDRSEGRLRAVEGETRRLEAAAFRAGLPGGLEAVFPLLASRERLEAAVAEVRDALGEDLVRARERAQSLRGRVEELGRNAAAGLAARGAPEPEVRRVEEGAGAALAEVDELIRELEALAGRRREGVGPGDAEALGRLEERQGRLAGRTEALAERLEGLARRVPLLDPALPGRARGARQAMGEAQGRLGEADPFGAVPPETRALEELTELAGDLEAALDQMGQGGPGGGLQVLRRPGRRPGMGTEVDRSPVEIPREAEARELRAFREEVLRAMQGRYPRDYEEEVERYYERLIR
ncbi:MAG: DUF4175 family protein [Deferrisomatales bacterium]